MKMKLIIGVVALLALGGVYKFVLAKPKAAEAKPKIEGVVYLLQKEFLVNLADGRYAKLSVALVLKETPVAEGGEEASSPPDGYGVEPQEAAARDIITDTLTDAGKSDLTDPEARERIKKKILKALQKHTDIEVTDVLFPDITVQ